MCLCDKFFIDLMIIIILQHREKDVKNRNGNYEGISTIAIPLNVANKIYIVFCIDKSHKQAKGDYILEYDYQNIFVKNTKNNSSQLMSKAGRLA